MQQRESFAGAFAGLLMAAMPLIIVAVIVGGSLLAFIFGQK